MVPQSYFLKQREKRVFNFTVNQHSLSYSFEPTRLGIKLDRTFIFRGHLELLCKKCDNAHRATEAGSSWGATVFCTVTLAMFHSSLTIVHLCGVALLILTCGQEN